MMLMDVAEIAVSPRYRQHLSHIDIVVACALMYAYARALRRKRDRVRVCAAEAGEKVGVVAARVPRSCSEISFQRPEFSKLCRLGYRERWEESSALQEER